MINDFMNGISLRKMFYVVLIKCLLRSMGALHWLHWASDAAFCEAICSRGIEVIWVGLKHSGTPVLLRSDCSIAISHELNMRLKIFGIFLLKSQLLDWQYCMRNSAFILKYVRLPVCLRREKLKDMIWACPKGLETRQQIKRTEVKKKPIQMIFLRPDPWYWRPDLGNSTTNPKEARRVQLYL